MSEQDKCPKCGAEFSYSTPVGGFNNIGRYNVYTCGTRCLQGRVIEEGKDCLSRQLAQAHAENATLKAERDAIQATLAAVEHEVALVYCHITNGAISKCNTEASQVISVADDIATKERDSAVAAERSRCAKIAESYNDGDSSALLAAEFIAAAIRQGGEGGKVSNPTYDGLRLLVQFYANHGCLRQVSERSGLDIPTLRSFADTGVISDADRARLDASQAHKQDPNRILRESQ